jgi:hypothetical protein
MDKTLVMSAEEWERRGYPEGAILFLSLETYSEDLERIRDRIMSMGIRRSARFEYTVTKEHFGSGVTPNPMRFDRPYQPDYEQHRPKVCNKKLGR